MSRTLNAFESYGKNNLLTYLRTYLITYFLVYLFDPPKDNENFSSWSTGRLSFDSTTPDDSQWDRVYCRSSDTRRR